MNYTSIEQSKKLAEILPLESADMRYTPFGDTHPWVWNEEVKLLEKDSVPCWSLGALLELMPRYINSGMVDCPLTIIPFDFENPHIKEHCWILRYTDYDEEREEYNFKIEQRGNTLIEAAYNMVVWLLEHGYIKTDKV